MGSTASESPTGGTTRASLDSTSPVITFRPVALSDFTIKSSKQEFKVHRVILARNPLLWERMLNQDYSETLSSILDLTDDDPYIVSVMVHFIYDFGRLGGYIWNDALMMGLEVSRLADKSDMPELSNYALGLIRFGCKSADLRTLAHVCLQVFQGEVERVSDAKLLQLLTEMAPTHWRKHLVLRDQTFRAMLNKVPQLGTEIALALDDDDAANYQKHYLIARCHAAGCISKGETWPYRVPCEQTHSRDIYCCWCSKLEVSMTLGEDSRWSDSRVELSCYKGGLGVDECGGVFDIPARGMIGIEQLDRSAIASMYCLICGSKGLALRKEAEEFENQRQLAINRP